MSYKYNVFDPQQAHAITCTVVDWINVFTRPQYNQLVLDSLRFCCERKELTVFAYCLMTNHLHLIGQAPDLPGVVRDFKKFTARALYRAIADHPQESRRPWLHWLLRAHGEENSHNTEIQFWQHGYHPVELRDMQRFEQRLRYVHENPVRAGICFAPEHYQYSSAGQYAGTDSQPLFPVTLAY